MKHRKLFSLAFFSLSFFPSISNAQQIGVGFYTPEISMTPYERFNYIQGLAKQLSLNLETSVQGFAYKSEADFKKDIKLKKIKFAIIGGFYLSTFNQGQPLAYAVIHNKQSANWSLLSKTKTDLSALKDKTLQLASVGPIVYGLIQNGLLGGNLEIRRHFKISESPDLTSAIEAIRLGQAQVVFAPVNLAGLKPILTNTVPVSNPAFVVLDQSLSKETIKQAKNVLLNYRAAAGSLVGWGGSNSTDYRRMATLAQRRLPRMEMVPLPMERLRQGELINTQAITYELPDIQDLYKIP